VTKRRHIKYDYIPYCSLTALNVTVVSEDGLSTRSYLLYVQRVVAVAAPSMTFIDPLRVVLMGDALHWSTAMTLDATTRSGDVALTWSMIDANGTSVDLRLYQSGVSDAAALSLLLSSTTLLVNQSAHSLPAGAYRLSVTARDLTPTHARMDGSAPTGAASVNVTVIAPSAVSACPTSPIALSGPACLFSVVGCAGCTSTYAGGCRRARTRRIDAPDRRGRRATRAAVDARDESVDGDDQQCIDADDGAECDTVRDAVASLCGVARCGLGCRLAHLREQPLHHALGV
jgi:hypothetical protein